MFFFNGKVLTPVEYLKSLGQDIKNYIIDTISLFFYFVDSFIYVLTWSELRHLPEVKVII